MPGSLKEALRQALEEDDKRELEDAGSDIPGGLVSIPVGNVIETVERSEMTFEEQAGELIPQEDE